MEQQTQLEATKEKKALEQITLFDEMDVYSKKRISLHKVAVHDINEPGKVNRYDYHMVIIDVTMTINITVGETAIVNLIKSLK